MEELTLKDLEGCFINAKETRSQYVAVQVKMQGFERPEIIINEAENFDTKLAYYKKAYNDDLTLKTFDGIKIIGFTNSSYFESIEDDLVIFSKHGRFER